MTAKLEGGPANGREVEIAPGRLRHRVFIPRPETRTSENVPGVGQVEQMSVGYADYWLAADGRWRFLECQTYSRVMDLAKINVPPGTVVLGLFSADSQGEFGHLVTMTDVADSDLHTVLTLYAETMAADLILQRRQREILRASPPSAPSTP